MSFDRALWRLALLAPLMAGEANAAIIRGVVMENQTGHPLARTLVTVQPVAGTNGATASLRTNMYGAFESPPLPGGAYLVSASRPGFVTSYYGQKRWNSAGVPFFLEEASSIFLDIRLKRFGAIAGTIQDENELGLSEHEVVAYRNTRPPQLAARAKADERGIFRIAGLEPGSYLVRTVAKQYREGSYLPTFAKESDAVEGALPVEVSLDELSGNMNVKPSLGRLFVVGCVLRAPVADAMFNVTLVSDMGRDTVTVPANSPVRFNPVAPGRFELYAQPVDLERYGMLGAFRTLVVVDRDVTDIPLQVIDTPPMAFTFRGTRGEPIDATAVKVLARRKDLAGTGPAIALKLAGGREPLAPGRWELSLAPNARYYAASFSGPRGGYSETGRADGWNEIAVGGYGSVRFTLSAKPAAMRGKVTSAGDPVAGVPVFLEAYDPRTRQRVTDLRTVWTDMRGQYQLTGLAPGTYRVLSTFEYLAPDSATMEISGARSVTVEDGQDLQQDLDLYGIR